MCICLYDILCVSGHYMCSVYGYLSVLCMFDSVFVFALFAFMFEFDFVFVSCMLCVYVCGMLCLCVCVRACECDFVFVSCGVCACMHVCVFLCVVCVSVCARTRFTLIPSSSRPHALAPTPSLMHVSISPL